MQKKQKIPGSNGYQVFEPEYKEAIGLIHVSHDDPGFTRQKCGRGFIYFDEKKRRITNPGIIERIKEIGIPPMWKNVWICKSPSGYLQATGIDVKNRKQYLYHEDWTAYQQNFKFQKMVKFANALPAIRETVKSHLRKKGWPKEKVLALIVGILNESYIRIGNRQYLELHGTHGLTTLRRKNLEMNSHGIIFKYKAKSNKYRRVKIRNRSFIRLIKECSELQGYEVFRYLDPSGKTIPVNSTDVNEYLKDITGEDFTSKNFRTWGGTVLAVKKFPAAKEMVEKNKRLKISRAIVKEVAVELHNTIAVCEKYYIHPYVLETLTSGRFDPEKFPLEGTPQELGEAERITLSIIKNGKIDNGEK
ncbi:MAG: DNA topoisomerase IB [Cyclobacteriaceae bacterium]|nr:DNA topoisomerase IB [Cyclobacteriaceae bacterium]